MRWLLPFLCLLPVLPVSAQEFRVHSITSGTGFIVDYAGHAITNAHVVQRCKRIVARGAVEEQEAKLIAQDATADLALLQLSGMPQAVATLKDSADGIKAGDPVVIIGFPRDHALSGEFKSGRATIREPSSLLEGRRYVRFDDIADIGNSGGPLLDASGHVIGVVVSREVTTRRNLLAAREETVTTSSLAIDLPALEAFLSHQGIYPYRAVSTTYLSEDTITNDARRYIINIHCALD